MARTLEELQKQYNRKSSNPARGGGMGGHGRMASGKPKNSKNVIKRLLSYLSEYKFRFIWVFLCMGVGTVSSLLGAYMLSPIINKVAGVQNTRNDFADRAISSVTRSLNGFLQRVTGNPNLPEVTAYLISGIICLALIFFFAIVATYAQRKIMLYISQNTIRKIRNDLFRKVQSLPVKFHDTNPTGEVMSRFTNDVDNIGMMLDSTLDSLISGTVTILGTLYFMIYTNIILAAITIVFIPVFTFGGIAIAKKSSKYYSAQQSALGAVNGYVEEFVTGLRIVKVFNREDDCAQEFAQLNNDLRGKQFFAQFYGGIMGPVMGNLSQIGYALTAGIGGILCFLTLAGTIPAGSVISLTVGGLTIFVSYARQFARPINEVSMQMSTVFSALAGAERVFNIMDMQPETPDCEKAADMNNTSGLVVLENVTFGYNPDKVILKNISLTAKPGQKIAFVGSTGAGKTTITNLMNRFYDIGEGKITIDGTDIKDIKRDALRSNIAMVLQDTHLFTATVMENIRYGRLDATDEEVIAAAKTASAHSFIMRLSDGYETLLNGDGTNLSQGQRQLLNIARAALSKAPILVLDEATSSVDTRTEKHIEQGMDSLMKNRTTFVIAHRLSTVRNADIIFVLENGVITERGSHEELLAQKGKYYQLHMGLAELD